MNAKIRRTALVALWSLGVGGCLSARTIERNYFVLFNAPNEVRAAHSRFDGLVRVRDMDSDSLYEKFQIVVRKSPYQLRYSEQNLWAVKPNQMVSDLLAQALDDTSTFSGVTRQLLESRPRFTMSGKVHAIELYDSGDVWFAHLSLNLRLARFNDGATIWSFEFDQRKPIEAGAFSHGIRALSELLHEAIGAALEDLHRRPSLTPEPSSETQRSLSRSPGRSPSRSLSRSVRRPPAPNDVLTSTGASPMPGR